MPRASKSRPAKRKGVRSRTDTPSQNSDDQEVVFVGENIEKKIGNYKIFLEDIQTTPDFKALPGTLRYEIKQALSSSTFTKSSVAFIGESGSGKSTTINALLGTQLLPTDSSGEACTAIAIEVHSSNGEKFYGIVKYVSLDSWREDLQHMQNMLRNESGDDADENEKLLEKAKLVYPHLTHKHLKEMTIDAILAENEAARKLEGDRTERLPNGNWDEFISSLYEHVVPNRRKSQIWPLVEVVELHIESPILQNGLVLIDVPGVLDSNRTRADRAQEYIRSSTAVCIVALAQRCISNATSYELIKDVLEQVQYGGHLDRVVMINSKSDDFEADQVRDRHDSPDIWEASAKREEAYRDFRNVSEALRNARKSLEEYETSSSQSKKDITTYKKLRTKLAKNQPVYEISRLETARSKDDRSPLTMSIINIRIEECETQKLNADKSIRGTRSDIATLEAGFKEKKVQYEDFLQCYYKQCLLARNNETKEQQRNQVIKIVKQLDEAAAISLPRDADGQNNEERSDEVYEARKREIPVFCVSAKVSLYLRSIKAYEDISLKKINNEDDTGVPALGEHLMSLAHYVRSERLDNTLNALTTTVRSVLLHMKDTSKRQVVDSDTAYRAASEAEELLQSLQVHFHECFKTCCSSIKADYNFHLKQKHNRFVKAAIREVTEGLEAYNENPTIRTKTGLYAQEYKAVVFGDGFHDGKRTKVNFNKKIGRYLQKVLHTSLIQLYLENDGSFGQKVQLSIRTCLEAFERTHNQMRRLADTAGVSSYAFEVVEDQFKERKVALHRLQVEVRRLLKETPPQAGKGLNSWVKNEMMIAYEKARSVAKGLGMRERMSSEVVAGAQRQDDGPIDRCLRELDTKLYEGTGEVLEVLKTRLEDFSNSVSQNYQDAFRHRDQAHWKSDHPVIRKMLLTSGLVSHKDLIEDGKVFDDEAAAIKAEATDTDVEMGNGGDEVTEERDDTMEGVEAEVSMDAIASDAA